MPAKNLLRKKSVKTTPFVIASKKVTKEVKDHYHEN
jgi:hypothetical protein